MFAQKGKKGTGAPEWPRGGVPAGRNPSLRRPRAARDPGEGGDAKPRPTPRAPRCEWQCTCDTREGTRHTADRRPERVAHP